jgi:hypothetical protein
MSRPSSPPSRKALSRSARAAATIAGYLPVPVEAAPGEQPHPVAIAPHRQTEAVVLDLVPPARAVGRRNRRTRQAMLDEAEPHARSVITLCMGDGDTTPQARGEGTIRACPRCNSGMELLTTLLATGPGPSYHVFGCPNCHYLDSGAAPKGGRLRSRLLISRYRQVARR